MNNLLIFIVFIGIAWFIYNTSNPIANNIDNQPILDSNGNPKVFNKPKYFNVFNISQVKGLEHLIETIEVPDKATTINNVQEFIDNCQAVIKFGGDRAFYSPGHDHIQMPNMNF